MLLHSPATCPILTTADPARDQAVLHFSSPKIARSGPHFCSWLSSATSFGLPKARSWPLLPLWSSLNGRGAQEGQAAVAAPPHPLTSCDKLLLLGRKQVTFSLQNLSQPPDQGFLMDPSSWHQAPSISSAHSLVVTLLSSMGWLPVPTPESMRKAGANLSSKRHGFLPQKKISLSAASLWDWKQMSPFASSVRDRRWEECIILPIF